MVSLTGLIAQIILGIILVAPVLWLSGRALAGKEKAKFSDAVWIVILGIVIGAVVGSFAGGLLAALIMFIVWLALIRHFFDCGWLKAFAVAIVAVVIFVILLAILAMIGIAALTLLF